MSTLKVNNLQDLGADAVVTNGVIASGALPAGSILQVVSATKTDAFSASVAAGAESGAVFSATITPSSTSSKVLVLISAQIAGTGTEAVYATLFRDSAVVTAATGDAEGSRKRVTSGGGDAVDSRLIASAMISFLDSPATTSSTTYDFRIAHGSGLTRTLYANRSAANDNSSSDSRSMSTITLMEVAG